MSTMLKVNKEDNSIATDNVTVEYAEDLVNAILKCIDTAEIYKLMGELRVIHVEKPEAPRA